MEKKTSKAFGKTVWLLGKDKDGVSYWLAEPSWDCGWYWGFGYVETYTNNMHPDKAKDIASHQHFNNMFLNGQKCSRDMFKEFFVETPLSDDKIWELVDYMQTFYTLKSAAELFRHGYSWQTGRAKINALQSEKQERLINNALLPEVFERIEKLFE